MWSNKDFGGLQSKADDTPKILFSNEMGEFTLWTDTIKEASFQRFPTRGDVVQVVIASAEQVSLSGDDDQAEQTKLSIMQNPIHTCIQFELDGFFQRNWTIINRLFHRSTIRTPKFNRQRDDVDH